MAEAEVTTTVYLRLDASEAEWLKALIQNPIVQAESQRDSRTRKAIWDVLDAVGVRSI